MKPADSRPTGLEAPELAACSGLVHGFFTRNGGVSQGLYWSLNCGMGSGDAKDRVAENRRRAALHLGLAPGGLRTVHQVHGNGVAVVGPGADVPPDHRADALVCATPKWSIGVTYADCPGVLLADPQARVIAAVHGGWRGTLAGVIEAAIARMIALGARPRQIRAGVGPCIQQNSYEVGEDLRQRFVARDRDFAVFFVNGRRAGHYYFDLQGLVLDRLKAAGVGRPVALHRDTCSEAGEFFSYRRATLAEEPDYGRHIALIGLD